MDFNPANSGVVTHLASFTIPSNVTILQPQSALPGSTVFLPQVLQSAAPAQPAPMELQLPTSSTLRFSTQRPPSRPLTVPCGAPITVNNQTTWISGAERRAIAEQRQRRSQIPQQSLQNQQRQFDPATPAQPLLQPNVPSTTPSGTRFMVTVAQHKPPAKNVSAPPQILPARTVCSSSALRGVDLRILPRNFWIRADDGTLTPIMRSEDGRLYKFDGKVFPNGTGVQFPGQTTQQPQPLRLITARPTVPSLPSTSAGMTLDTATQCELGDSLRLLGVGSSVPRSPTPTPDDPGPPVQRTVDAIAQTTDNEDDVAAQLLGTERSDQDISPGSFGGRTSLAQLSQSSSSGYSSAASVADFNSSSSPVCTGLSQPKPSHDLNSALLPSSAVLEAVPGTPQRSSLELKDPESPDLSDPMLSGTDFMSCNTNNQHQGREVQNDVPLFTKSARSLFTATARNRQFSSPGRPLPKQGPSGRPKATAAKRRSRTYERSRLAPTSVSHGQRGTAPDQPLQSLVNCQKRSSMDGYPLTSDPPPTKSRKQDISSNGSSLHHDDGLRWDWDVSNFDDEAEVGPASVHVPSPVRLKSVKTIKRASRQHEPAASRAPMDAHEHDYADAKTSRQSQELQATSASSPIDTPCCRQGSSISLSSVLADSTEADPENTVTWTQRGLQYLSDVRQSQNAAIPTSTERTATSCPKPPSPATGEVPARFDFVCDVAGSNQTSASSSTSEPLRIETAVANNDVIKPRESPSSHYYQPDPEPPKLPDPAPPEVEGVIINDRLHLFQSNTVPYSSPSFLPYSAYPNPVRPLIDRLTEQYERSSSRPKPAVLEFRRSDGFTLNDGATVPKSRKSRVPEVAWYNEWKKEKEKLRAEGEAAEAKAAAEKAAARAKAAAVKAKAAALRAKTKSAAKTLAGATYTCARVRPRAGYPHQRLRTALSDGCARLIPFSRDSYKRVFNWFHPLIHPALRRHAMDDEERDRARKEYHLRSRAAHPLSVQLKFFHEKPKLYRLGKSTVHGVGIFATMDVEQGELILEYFGEIIRSSLADHREAAYRKKCDRLGVNYVNMFRLDEQHIIDATLHGGPARFINHSCDPTCHARVISADGNKHILLIASRDIEEGEELSYDYKLPFEKDTKIRCNCHATNCRKYLN